MQYSNNPSPPGIYTPRLRQCIGRVQSNNCFMPVHILDHAIVRDALTTLRDKGSSTTEFRAALRLIARGLAYEATRTLPVSATHIQTPLAETPAAKLTARVIAIPVLRAGLGLLHEFTELVPEALLGFIGLKRDEHTLQPGRYYYNVPATDGAHVFVLDPMLATGGSINATLGALNTAVAARCSVLCVLAAPEGLAEVTSGFPDVHVYTASVEEKLNDLGYILPGLGDAGDRLCGI